MDQRIKDSWKNGMLYKFYEWLPPKKIYVLYKRGKHRTEQAKEHRQIPKVRKLRREYSRYYSKTPKRKAYMKKYNKKYSHLPEVIERKKELMRAYKKTPKFKARIKEYLQRPETKELRNKQSKKFYQKHRKEILIKQKQQREEAMK